MEKTNGWKAFLCFFALAIWFVGVLGGIGYALYLGKYLIAVGIAVAGIYGIPTVKKLLKVLTD